MFRSHDGVVVGCAHVFSPASERVLVAQVMVLHVGSSALEGVVPCIPQVCGVKSSATEASVMYHVFKIVTSAMPVVLAHLSMIWYLRDKHFA